MKAPKTATRIKRKLRHKSADSILKQLGRQRIRVPTRREVSAYIVQHSKLGSLLPEICAQLRRGFSPAVELSLELYRDLESGDRYLTLYVRQEAYDPGIIKRIDDLSQGIDDNLASVPGYLLITTDFARPRRNHAV